MQNVVGSVTLGFKPSLLTLSGGLGPQATYEPEMFPGLTYRMTAPRAVMLIFASGKAVITGAKCENDINTALEEAYPIIAKYQRA
jgi:transcription initiation factor TFIID TATA-box-binding protein